MQFSPPFLPLPSSLSPPSCCLLLLLSLLVFSLFSCHTLYFLPPPMQKHLLIKLNRVRNVRELAETDVCGLLSYAYILSKKTFPAPEFIGIWHACLGVMGTREFFLLTTPAHNYKNPHVPLIQQTWHANTHSHTQINGASVAYLSPLWENWMLSTLSWGKIQNH